MGKALAFLVMVASFVSCGPHTGGGDPGKPSKIISCGGDALAHCAPSMLGPVNECLSGESDIVGCLGGFVRPAECAAVDYVACLVRHEGAASAAIAREDPSNVRDARRAARAREYLQRIGAQFEPSAAP